MTVTQLLAALRGQVGILEQRGDVSRPVQAITDDSRAVTVGSLFVAVKGERVDGHGFVEQAIKAGAVAVIAQAPVASGPLPFVLVVDSRKALGLLGSRFYGDPSARLKMIGVTGTNGKTTTTYLCKALLEGIGRRVGLIGTVGYQIGQEIFPASHTTPGALDLQTLLAKMVESGLTAAVMEVSSHALALDRTSGCEYDVAVFTNLTQDHLDFHHTMDEYFEAKLRLFTGLAGGQKAGKRAIVNVDDPRGAAILAACPVPVWSYAIQSQADLKAEGVRLSLAGTTFTAATPAGSFTVESRLVGEHNVYNLLGAIGVALHDGATIDQIREATAHITNVPGRFERVFSGQDFTVVVDYAHTEDALVRLLTAAQALKTDRIITVFGCGGDRDRGKRPKMGRAAVEYSDVVVLTSDNPRTEDPMAILHEVEVGVRDALERRSHVQYRLVPDRREAIAAAIREARRGDMVLIAGKGHEDYQIIGTKKFHFDDREVAREAIQQLQDCA
ncbi:MAG: UDP-N-acetylmuramoyl-L-alanyl-D-glutamate--2,6-diaminopimelate ligase [Nitrospirae bacterium]|nr:UDP-N-acetylmuramoyl-L-alanyl-D-glutamate--2,6-diaminopimelate ligase [Nitrospirota bacterium]MBU6479308.1 UDP-N-acetylmuramoyl-L-alanyl-D-glutamate--2,6-diaminopimelate ligase [Nitrospirota bacterium]